MRYEMRWSKGMLEEAINDCWNNRGLNIPVPSTADSNISVVNAAEWNKLSRLERLEKMEGYIKLLKDLC